MPGKTTNARRSDENRLSRTASRYQVRFTRWVAASLETDPRSNRAYHDGLFTAGTQGNRRPGHASTPSRFECVSGNRDLAAGSRDWQVKIHSRTKGRGAEEKNGNDFLNSPVRLSSTTPLPQFS